MSPAQQEVTVHHFLHNNVYGKTKATRLSNKAILIHLPDLDGRGEDFVMDMDIRDKRTVFVFDGDVPNGSIPKRAAIARRTNLGLLIVPVENVRLKKEGEEQPPFHIVGRFAELPLYRNFLLLPGSRSIGRLYRTKSPSPRYLIIEVDKKSGRDKVNTYTTDY